MTFNEKNVKIALRYRRRSVRYRGCKSFSSASYYNIKLIKRRYDKVPRTHNYTIKPRDRLILHSLICLPLITFLYAHNMFL